MANSNVLPILCDAVITDITTTISGEDTQANRLLIEEGGAAGYVTTTNATVLVTTAMIASNGTGNVSRLVFGNPQGSATVTLHDGTTTSATVIASITLPSTAPAPFDLPLGIRVSAGLTVKQSANNALTVVYR